MVLLSGMRSVHALKGEGYLYVCWEKKEEGEQPTTAGTAATKTNVSYWI